MIRFSRAPVGLCACACVFVCVCVCVRVLPCGRISLDLMFNRTERDHSPLRSVFLWLVCACFIESKAHVHAVVIVTGPDLRYQ